MEEEDNIDHCTRASDVTDGYNREASGGAQFNKHVQLAELK